ncbi:MAG: hypothetical protein WD118_07175 [Phycisphaeraceae bacterium]
MMEDYTQDIFELVLARPVMHRHGDDAMQVHLWWRAPQQGERLVQVYTDDALYDVTAWPSQRAMWLALDRRRPCRIALLAVDPAGVDSVWQARPELLGTWSPQVTDVARLSVLRDEGALPVSSAIRVEVDGALMADVPVWPAGASRGGFGALFGEGGFGIDAATGPGLGQGELGFGPLGADGVAWHWRRDDLAEGSHAVTLRVQDLTGQAVLASDTHRLLTIARLPAPAERVWCDSSGTLRWQS